MNYELRNENKINKGFTLIEIMVSVSIFSMVMVIVVGALLVLNDANKKAQALRAIVDNLNFAVEDMTRSIRTGKDYNCGFTLEPKGEITTGSEWKLKGCEQIDSEKGVDTLVFKGQTVLDEEGNPKGVCYLYSLTKPDADNNNKRTLMYGRYQTNHIDDGCTLFPFDGKEPIQFVSPEVQINALKFFVFDKNSVPSNPNQQPFVVITLSGEIDVSQYRFKTPFNIQTTVSQRSSGE